MEELFAKTWAQDRETSSERCPGLATASLGPVGRGEAAATRIWKKRDKLRPLP